MMTAIAARTTRLRFGMNALVVPFRDPLAVAKQIASIDYLSNGRILPTFGVGIDNDPYWRATGRPAAGRGTRANEAIILIRALLEQEEVAFEGVHYQYNGSGIWPRPAQPIPLWIGGDSAAAIRRAASMGDGWLGGLSSIQRTTEVIAQIKSELASNGRQIDDDHYGATVLFRIGASDDPAVLRMRKQLASRLNQPENELSEIITAGDAETIISHFRKLITGGVAKFVAVPISHDGEDLLDQTSQLARDIIPAIEE